MCSTRALMAGDGDVLADIYQERSFRRGYGSGAYGWTTAYGNADRGRAFGHGASGSKGS